MEERDEVLATDLVEPLLIEERDVVYLKEDENSAARITRLIKTVWEVINSGILIPDAFKGHPYTAPTILALFFLILLFPIKLYFIFTVLGFFAALFLIDKDDGNRHEGLQHKFEFISERLNFEESKISSQVPKPTTLNITPRIDSALDVMLDRLVTSLVDSWYMQINKSGQREFQSCIRTTLDAFLMNLKGTVHGLGKDSLTLYIYGITNALNVHMQEFKNFGRSKLETPKEFLSSSQSRRSFFPSTQAEVNHLRQIVLILLKKLLPSQESKSIIVISLVKELIASGALWNAMDRLCDPDFINMKIVETLKEPSDIYKKLEPGWNLVVIKILKGENFEVDGDEGGFYCIIHIAGRKVKTRRIENPNSPIWNEIFQFKVSDQVLSHLQVHIQLCRYSYVGKDSTFGFAKISPESVESPEYGKQAWLQFKKGQVFVESSVIKSSSKSSTETQKESLGVKPLNMVTSELKLDEALKNNEIFMEFYEFMKDFKAPPYLQFFMNFEAYRQFTSMELGIDPNIPEAIDNYFRYRSLSEPQVDQLKLIKNDAQDLFNNHFVIESKNYIELNESILNKLKDDLSSSAQVDLTNNYIGNGPIGPNIFIPVYKWIFDILEEVYFEKFKSSTLFKKYHQTENLNHADYTLEDDTTSVFSMESKKYDCLDLNFDESCDDQEMDMKKISTAISILKQQLAVIEDKLEVAPRGSNDYTKLKKSQKDLEGQVKSLVNLAKSKEAGSSQELWLDLKNVSVKVLAPSADNISTSSLWSSSNPIFDVEVVRIIDGQEPIVLSVVSKAFSDFEGLHTKLKKEFPKLDKIPFPRCTDSDLRESLQLFMDLLLSDEFIRQSGYLREFVSLDSDLEGKTIGRMVESLMGKKVKNVLQTATSILSVGMIGSPVKKKGDHFYQTRDYHTTTDISNVECQQQQQNSLSTLHRSCSTTFLREEEGSGKGLLSVPSPAKTVPPTPIKSRKLEEATSLKSNDSPAIFKIEEFTEAEVDMLMETVYTFITETFDLREPNQWIRRKVLSVSKQFLKQAYSETLGQVLTDSINNGLKEDAWLKYIDEATKALWPNGIFIKDIPPPIRTPEQQLATQIEARTLFLNKIPDSIEKLAGRYNAVNGITRIFNMLQHKEFNKLLFMTIIDITVKILFTEQVKT